VGGAVLKVKNGPRQRPTDGDEPNLEHVASQAVAEYPFAVGRWLAIASLPCRRTGKNDIAKELQMLVGGVILAVVLSIVLVLVAISQIPA
jgi:hypothetical protein